MFLAYTLTYREIYNIQYRIRKIRVARVRCGAENMLNWDRKENEVQKITT